MNLGLHLDTDADAGPLLDAILPIYSAVYVEPPYCEDADDIAAFVESWTSRVSSPRFRLVRADLDGHPAGFAFGHELSEDTAWWDGALSPLPPDLTAERTGRTFAIIELAVLRDFRRRGVARAMHDRLINGTRAERVTLLVRPEPEAAPARAAYQSWGYRKLGQLRPYDDAPVYDLMLRDRHN